MTADPFERRMTEWAAHEERAAPELHPTEEVLRRLEERRGRGPRRSNLPLRWAAAAAALVALLVALRAVLGAHTGATEHVRIEPWTLASGARIDGATLREPNMRGDPKGGAFAQLVFQHHRPGTDVIFGVDLLGPASAPVELATGDRYRLGLRARGDRSVYVLQVFPRGGRRGVACLYPALTTDEPLRSGAPRWLPAEPDWLVLADAGGEETVRVVAATAPIPSLEDLCQRIRTAQLAPEQDALADSLDLLLDGLTRMQPTGVEVTSFTFRGRP